MKMYLKLVNFNNFNFFNVKVDNNLCHESWQNKNLIVAYFRLTSEVFIKKFSVKALNGEHFLKLHLSSNELCDNNILKAAACAIKKTGLQMVGNEIYKSDLPNKQKGKGIV